MLLSWRASVNGQKLDLNEFAGETALHCAARQGHATCCEILLKYRADACIRDAKALTPLHTAFMEPLHVIGNCSRDASEKVVALLLAARGELQARDATGRTPLDLADVRGVTKIK